MGLDTTIRILVVDDMQPMRGLVISTLKTLGFTEFFEAENGEKAWEIVAHPKSRIRLIVSDWNMPNMAGLELLRRVRDFELTSKIPFLMVTSESDKDQIMSALKAGASSYIIKPFSGEGLEEKLKKILK